MYTVDGILSPHIMITLNEHALDRYLRIAGSIIFFTGGYFWAAGMLQIVLLMLSIVLFLTGISGFCPAYLLIHVNTKKSCSFRFTTWAHVSIISTLFLLLLGGIYGSIFFTNKFFLEDFSKINNAYKQALFQTGQGNRDLSTEHIKEFSLAFNSFRTTYTSYTPFSLRHDRALMSDFSHIDILRSKAFQIITTSGSSLQEAHRTLEEVRPILQDMLKRNGFSQLAVALVDFHDVMEIVLDSTEKKDVSATLQAYKRAHEALLLVEREANDSDIQSIRTALEAVKKAAEGQNTEALPALGQTLKSSFVKVYLQRG